MRPWETAAAQSVERETARILNPMIGDNLEHTGHVVFEHLDHLVEQLWETDNPQAMAGAFEWFLAALAYELAQTMKLRPAAANQEGAP